MHLKNTGMPGGAVGWGTNSWRGQWNGVQILRGQGYWVSLE